jgi:biotin carboxyl carrier protein
MPGPALRPGIRIIEQLYRGERSYVIKDPVSHKYFRFRPAEAAVIRRFDGSRSAAEIAADLAAEGMVISAAGIATFARTLAELGLLERSLQEQTSIELERLRNERRRRRSLFRGEWLRMRWSVGDADRFFDWLTPRLWWGFSRPFVVGSIALFLVYGWILSSRWADFTAATAATFAPAALDPGRILILIATFFGLTLVHELAHGIACKHYGGEVHELGFMLLYFTPAFFCNVNDAWSFPERRARLWVTAAGTWVELGVTAIAAIVWVLAAPGTLLSQVAIATVLIGGFSAIISNANPLLPLDGYFALVDWLEIPNLRRRAAAQLTWWVRWHVLRLEMPPTEATPREQRIFLWYGTLAAIYITLFLGWIALAVVGRAYRAIGFVGGAIVVVLILALLRRRLVTGWRGLVLAVRARSGGARWRAWRRRGPWVLIGLLVIAALVPWDLTTAGSFTVAAARNLAITAPDSGVVVAMFGREGEALAAGQPVLEILQLDLGRAAAVDRRLADSLATVVREARAGADAGEETRAAAESTGAAAELAATRSRIAMGTIRARIAGTVVTPHPEAQIGRRVGAGDTLLLLQDLGLLEARIRLSSAGAVRVAAGQPVRLVSYQRATEPFEGAVASVAPIGAGGPLEARVTLPAATALRVGATGEARVVLRRSTLLGALWWEVRGRIRNDLLL